MGNKFSRKKNMSLNIPHPLETLQQIEKEDSSLSKINMSSNIPHPLETLQQIEKELSPDDMYSYDQLKLLTREFKFLDIILNSKIYIDETDVKEKVQVLFQSAAADVIEIDPKSSSKAYARLCLHRLNNKFWVTKLKIRAEYSIPKISFQLLANKDGIVVPELVMEFIDTVEKNLSDLLTFNAPSSSLYVGGVMGQIENALKELKVLRSFVSFISCRCIEPQGQQTFFSYALEGAWHTIMVTWLYIPTDIYGSAPDEKYPLFSDVLRSKIQPIVPSICKIYIDVLQALKLVESQMYPDIDCEVGFVEALQINLKELPVSSNCAAIKATLQEILNILRTNLINLPTKALEVRLRDIDSVIVDAGLLVYSLIGNKNEKEVTALEETNQALIQSMKEIFYFITRESFHLGPNLPRNDGFGSTGFILDNLQEFIGCHLDSASSTKSQLQTMHNEIKCLQKVVEHHDGHQHFAERVMSLAYEVESVIDACKEVLAWCLSIWMSHIIEDIHRLTKDIKEMKVSDLGLHNTTEVAWTHTPQFASNPSRNEEMVGFEDVMVELINY